MLRKEQCCKNCDAWLQENGQQGLCRAHPPVPIMIGVGQPAVISGPNAPPLPAIQSNFPMLMAFGWCREWRQKTEGEA